MPFFVFPNSLLECSNYRGTSSIAVKGKLAVLMQQHSNMLPLDFLEQTLQVSERT